MNLPIQLLSKFAKMLLWKLFDYKIHVSRNLEEFKKKDIFSDMKNLEIGVKRIISRFNTWRYGREIEFVIAELPGLRLDRRIARENELLCIQQKIFYLLYKIKICVSRVVKKNLTEIISLLREFGSVFSSLIETLLTDIVRESIDILYGARTDSSLQDSLNLVSKLGLEGNHICRIFAREGGVATLLRILSGARTHEKGMILRALGTICCVEDGVHEFQSKDGLELVAGVLREGSGVEEQVQMEAAGVLAQVTSPWIENSLDPSRVDQHAYDLVSSLTKLCRETKSAETLLLCSAGLANLSYISPLLLTAMSQVETIPSLLSFIYNQVSTSIYILDQVATILANLAASQHTRDALLQHDIVPALLLLLAVDYDQSNPSIPLLSATQRVQQKAAIAIGRLSAYTSICLSILSGGGLDRLVELSVCKDARLDSEFTLVSVVTAVRKISQTVDITAEINKLGASDILNSNILHSIQIYNPMQESFV